MHQSSHEITRIGSRHAFARGASRPTAIRLQSSVGTVHPGKVDIWIPLERLTSKGKHTCDGTGGAELHLVLDMEWNYRRKATSERLRELGTKSELDEAKLSEMYLEKKATVIQRAVRNFQAMRANEHERMLMENYNMKVLVFMYDIVTI